MTGMKKSIEVHDARIANHKLRVSSAKAEILSAQPGNAYGQLTMLLERFNPMHMSVIRNKSTSDKTQENRRKLLKAFLDQLNSMGFKIRNIYNLDNRHISAFFEHCENIYDNPGYFTNYHSAIRALMRWIDKESELRPLKSYLKDKSKAKRFYTAVDDKSWESQGVDVDAVLNRVAEYDERVAMVMRLMHAFGLRKKEGVNFKPHIHISLDETQLEVEDGTKGGRPRVIPIETDHQRMLLEQAKAMCKKRSSFLLNPDNTLKQNMSRMDNVCKKFHIVGHAKPGKIQNPHALGVTMHGLRHGYASRVYHEKTGHLSPVQGGPVSEYYAEEHKEARLDISERLGHSRIGITNAYLGGKVNYKQVRKTERPPASMGEPEGKST